MLVVSGVPHKAFVARMMLALASKYLYQVLLTGPLERERVLEGLIASSPTTTKVNAADLLYRPCSGNTGNYGSLLNGLNFLI